MIKRRLATIKVFFGEASSSLTVDIFQKGQHRKGGCRVSWGARMLLGGRESNGGGRQASQAAKSSDVLQGARDSHGPLKKLRKSIPTFPPQENVHNALISLWHFVVTLGRVQTSCKSLISHWSYGLCFQWCKYYKAGTSLQRLRCRRQTQPSVKSICFSIMFISGTFTVQKYLMDR